MPFDAFLKIEGVPGESNDSKHKDEIELLSFSFGVLPGGRKPQPVLQDFRFTKVFDTASARLLEAACTGDRMSQAVLSVRRTGGKVQQDFIKITMQEVIVSSHTAGGAPGGSSSAPMEDVALSFANMEMEVRRQLSNGSFGPPVTSNCAAKGGKSGVAAEEEAERDKVR